MQNEGIFLKKLRFAALLLAVFALLSAVPASAAPSAAEPVICMEELAWKIMRGVQNGELSFEFSGYDPFGDVAGLLAMCGSGMWLNINTIKWVAPKRPGDSYSIELVLYETAEMRKECEDRAKDIAGSLISPGMSRRDKYLALHDWVAVNCTYDLGAKYNGQLAWNVLSEGRAVCNGYAKAYKLLCDAAGLPCVIVSGSATDAGKTESHTWNLVPCDGRWLYVDVTWDDPDRGQTVLRNYFMVAREQMDKDHKLSMDYTKLSTLLYPDREDMADVLFEFGLFAGNGAGYDLLSVPDRNQCAAMYLKLLGLGSAYGLDPALYSHPFTDVASWASGHVAVMYTLGYTSGISPTIYGGYMPLTLQQYSTFVMRALGYSTGADFDYDRAVAFCVSKGLYTSGEAEAIELRGFLRGDMVMLTYRALYMASKGGGLNLLDSLVLSGAVSLPNAA